MQCCVMGEAAIPTQRRTKTPRVVVNDEAFERAFRAKGCMTGEQRAELLGTTRQSVERWATGAVEPKIGRALRIAETLGVDPSDLWSAA